MSRIMHDTFYISSEDQSLAALNRSLEYHLYKLHQEKQQEVYLNNQINHLESKLQKSKKTTQASLKPSEITKSLSKLKAKVENTTCKLNTLHNENEMLRMKIDTMRQEGSKYKRMIGQLNQEIDESSFIARASSQSKLQIKSEEQTNKEKIYELLNKSTTQRDQLNSKFTKIATGISRLKRTEAESIKKHTEKVIESINRPYSAFDACPLLQKQLENSCLKTQEIRKEHRRYRKNCKSMRTGLGKILSALPKPDYVAQAQQFIDSENQMKNVQVYLLNLSSEIDSICSSNDLIMQGLKKTTKSKVNEILAPVKKQLISIKEKIDLLNFESSVLIDAVDRVEGLADKILAKYECRENFDLGVDGDTKLNQKLAKIDQLIQLTLDLKNSSLRNLRSSSNSDAEDREPEFVSFKHVIGHLNISQKVIADKSPSINFIKLSKSDI